MNNKQEKFNYKISIDLSKKQKVKYNCILMDTYVSWITCWLKKNCTHEWILENNNNKIDIYFEKSVDGVAFKLSSDYFIINY